MKAGEDTGADGLVSMVKQKRQWEKHSWNEKDKRVGALSSHVKQEEEGKLYPCKRRKQATQGIQVN